MSAELDFVEGIAGVLVTANGYVYRPDGSAYTDAEIGIVLGALPPSPDRMIGLSVYRPQPDDPDLPIGTLAVQVRIRGTEDPRVELSMSGACYSALHGLKHRTFGTIHVGQLRWRSGLPLPADDNHRTQSSSNYYGLVDYPATANRTL